MTWYLQMGKEKKSRLPILIALLFLAGVISLGAAAYLIVQEPQLAGASEGMPPLP